MEAKIQQALAQGQVIDITTMGRRSGLPRRIEISFQNVNGRIFILGGTPGPRDWLANLKAAPSFTFHLKESVQADLPAKARIITDSNERRAIFNQVLKQTSSDGDLEAMVAGSPLVEVLLDDH